MLSTLVVAVVLFVVSWGAAVGAALFGFLRKEALGWRGRKGGIAVLLVGAVACAMYFYGAAKLVIWICGEGA